MDRRVCYCQRHKCVSRLNNSHQKLSSLLLTHYKEKRKQYHWDTYTTKCEKVQPLRDGKMGHYTKNSILSMRGRACQSGLFQDVVWMVDGIIISSQSINRDVNVRPPDQLDKSTSY